MFVLNTFVTPAILSQKLYSPSFLFWGGGGSGGGDSHYCCCRVSNPPLSPYRYRNVVIGQDGDARVARWIDL